MAAKVKKDFPGLADGEVKVRNFVVGETIHGELARVAIENGWADEVEEEKPAEAGEVGRPNRRNRGS